MIYEVVMTWSMYDNEFHYDLYINHCWICYLCSFKVIKVHLKKWFYKFWIPDQKVDESFMKKLRNLHIERYLDERENR